jgi:DNA-binding PadR family transcriptional regulator
VSTRLLLLGAVRILQPVNGYQVRRELLSWHMEDWLNVKPGSVYSGLRTLEKDGLIARTERGRSTEGGRPESTEYVLTADGLKEFTTLLRKAWWVVEHPADPLVPALSLLPFMTRDELVAALQARIGQLQSELEQFRFIRSGIRDGATGADGEVPDHVRELIDFASSRTRADLDWSRALLKRLRDGTYRFHDEDPDRAGTASTN